MNAPGRIRFSPPAPRRRWPARIVSGCAAQLPAETTPAGWTARAWQSPRTPSLPSPTPAPEKTCQLALLRASRAQPVPASPARPAPAPTEPARPVPCFAVACGTTPSLWTGRLDSLPRASVARSYYFRNRRDRRLNRPWTDWKRPSKPSVSKVTSVASRSLDSSPASWPIRRMRSALNCESTA